MFEFSGGANGQNLPIRGGGGFIMHSNPATRMEPIRAKESHQEQQSGINQYSQLFCFKCEVLNLGDFYPGKMAPKPYITIHFFLFLGPLMAEDNELQELYRTIN